MKLKKIPAPLQWRKLEYHPLSEITEFGAGIDTEGLLGHMSKGGFDASEPVVLFEEKILDGRHRYSAAVQSEVEPAFAVFQGTEAEALWYVEKKMHRQHLDTGQRAMFAAGLATLEAGRPKTPSKEGVSKKSAAAAGKSMKVSRSSVERAKLVTEKCSPSVQQAVRDRTVKLGDAAKVATLSHKVQDAALAAVRAGKTKTLWSAATKATGDRKAKGSVKDELGNEVPRRCRDAFADKSLKNLIASLEETAALMNPDTWVKTAGKLTDHYGFILIAKFKEHAYESLDALQLALEALKAGLPYAVCPKCSASDEFANGKTCKACRGYGHVPETHYKELVA